MKDIGDILSSSLTAATWGFDFCSVELTLWAVIDWAASTSALEDMGENCSPSTTPPGFQVALGLNAWNRDSRETGLTSFWDSKIATCCTLNQKCHLEQGSPVGNIHIRFLLSTRCVPGCSRHSTRRWGGSQGTPMKFTVQPRKQAKL